MLFRMVAENPDTARGYWMGAHLVNTYLLVAALTLHAWWASVRSPEGRNPPSWLARCRLRRPRDRHAAVGITGAIAALGDTLFPVDSLAEGLAQDLDPTSQSSSCAFASHTRSWRCHRRRDRHAPAPRSRLLADRSTVRRHAFAPALVGVASLLPG
ncbi:MAG: hypothetical protein R3B99_02945 [Polyangiales bacterium]